MDKDGAGFFVYDKAGKRGNTWCIPSFDNAVIGEKTSRIVQIIFEQCL
jgi:hypothetical protein